MSTGGKENDFNARSKCKIVTGTILINQILKCLKEPSVSFTSINKISDRAVAFPVGFFEHIPE